ncbi:MAG: factor-independent urate hydroxylase [Planctomycetota bacterium]
MTRLIHQSYGKHNVCVSKIKRDPANPGHHTLVEAEVCAELEGGFDSAYTEADNRSVIATDSIRNTVYAIAKDDPWETIEGFGLALGQHFLRQYEHVDQATITLREHLWHRLNGHNHAFTGSDRETPTATIVVKRGTAASVTSGVDDLMLAKTTQSGFSDFVEDEYRTLPDTDDRILATVLKAEWEYVDSSASSIPFAEHRGAIRAALLGTFTDHYSVSVQQTLYLMGAAALESCPAIEQITLTMPNKHHIRFNLEPLGRANENEVFVVTDKPSGFIHATVGR